MNRGGVGAGRTGVGSEAEGFAANDLVTGDGGAPVFFDVPGDEIVAGEMIDVRSFSGVVHAVGEIAYQDDVLAEADQLADGEGAAQDAHVLVNAHNDGVRDAALAHEEKGISAVGDGVLGVDFDVGDLSSPWGGLRALGIVVATAVGVVDGQRRFMVGHAIAARFLDGLEVELRRVLGE